MDEEIGDDVAGTATASSSQLSPPHRDVGKDMDVVDETVGFEEAAGELMKGRRRRGSRERLTPSRPVSERSVEQCALFPSDWPRPGSIGPCETQATAGNKLFRPRVGAVMDSTVGEALKRGGTVDITTIGRKSLVPENRNLFHSSTGSSDLTGRPGFKRDWVANIVANPEFTLHLSTASPPTSRSVSLSPIQERPDPLPGVDREGSD